MGTLLAATLPVGESDVHARHVATIFETAGVCEDVMSRHRPDAGVSRLNARAGDPEGIVSAELARVLALARRLAESVDGEVVAEPNGAGGRFLVRLPAV